MYWHRPRQKLGQGLEENEEGSVTSDTIATDFQSEDITYGEEISDYISQTSYAPSLINGDSMTVPPLPNNEKPFECPLCHFIVDIKIKESWARHVFRDLRPYVCTFPDCHVPDRRYASRHEWFDHETSTHSAERLACPLCPERMKTSKQFERHLARHMEDLALFALPSSLWEGDKDEGVSGHSADDADLSTSDGSFDNDDESTQEKYNPGPQWWCGWCSRPSNRPMTIAIHQKCLYCQRPRDVYSSPPATSGLGRRY